MIVDIIDNAETLTIQDQVVRFFAAMTKGTLDCPLIEEKTFKVYKPAYNLVGAGKSSLLTEAEIQSIKDRGIAFIDNHYVEGKTAVFTPDTWLILYKHSGEIRTLIYAAADVLKEMGINGVEVQKEQDIEINGMKVAGWAGAVCKPMSSVGETMLVTFHADREFFETVLPAEEFDRTATVGDPKRGWDGIDDIIGEAFDRDGFIQRLIAKLEEIAINNELDR